MPRTLNADKTFKEMKKDICVTLIGVTCLLSTVCGMKESLDGLSNNLTPYEIERKSIENNPVLYPLMIPGKIYGYAIGYVKKL